MAMAGSEVFSRGVALAESRVARLGVAVTVGLGR